MSEKALDKNDTDETVPKSEDAEAAEAAAEDVESGKSETSTEEASAEGAEKQESTEEQPAPRKRGVSAMKLTGRIVIGIGVVVLLVGMVASIRYALSSDDANDDEVLLTQDGVYSVPDDMPLGKYRSPGGENCVWQRLADPDGGEENVIQSGEASMQAQIVVIREGDAAFSTQGCTRWRKFH